MLLKKSKRRAFFIFIIAFVIIVASLSSIYIVFRKDISDLLTRQAGELVSKTFNVRLTAGKINGNILRGVELSDVAVVLASGDSLSGEKINIEYDLWSIISQRGNRIHQLKINRPVIYLIKKTIKPTLDTETGLKLALPLLFINRLEIVNGCILSDGKVIIDTIFLNANLKVRAEQAELQIRKLSFNMPDLAQQVHNIQGTVTIDNNAVRLSDFDINSSFGAGNFSSQVNLTTRTAELKIKKVSVLLGQLDKNNDGEITLAGLIAVDFNKSGWVVANLTGALDCQFSRLSIQSNSIPDGKGKLVIKNNKIEVGFTAMNIDSITRYEVNLISDIRFNPVTYQGKLNFINLPITSQTRQHSYLTGNGHFSGIGAESIEVEIFAASQNPQVESIAVRAGLRQKKIILQNLRIRHKTNLLDASGYLYLNRRRPDFGVNLNFNEFSLNYCADLLTPFLLRKIDLAGVVNGSVKIESRGGKLASSAKLTIMDGTYDHLQFDYLALGFQSDDMKKPPAFVNLNCNSVFWEKHYFTRIGCIVKDSLFALNADKWQDKSLRAQGYLQFADKDISCKVESLQIISVTDTIVNTQEFSFGKNDSYMYLKDLSLRLGLGRLSCDWSKNRDRRVTVNLLAEQINLDNISDFARLKHRIDGIVNLNITSGSNLPSQSGLNINLTGSDIKIPSALLNNHTVSDPGQIALKSINGNFSWSDSVFSINRFSVVHNLDTSKISGAVMLARQPIDRLSLDIVIDFADPGTWLFFFLKQTADLREGKIYGQMRVRGSLRAPELSGQVMISDGNLYVVPTKTPCQDVTAQLSFNKLNINIDKIHGRVASGNLNARGFVKLLEMTKVDTLSIGVTFKDTPFRPTADIFAIASGQINIDLRESNGIREKTPLALSGDVVIKSALITTDFESPASVRSGESNEIDLNLRISGERDIWLRNRMCDVELGANLNLFSQDNANIYSGTLNAIQGNFYYLDHALRLTEGTLTFDNISDFNPQFDVRAEMSTRLIEVPGGGQERIKILLSVTGRLDAPVFAFSSSPVLLSENDILSYLTFNVTWQELSAVEARELFTNALSEKLLGYFERELTKRIRALVYLDYLWIESGLLSGNGAKVTVGKYISPKFYFSYEYDITGNVYDIFRLEYYLSKSHELIGEHDKEGRYKLKYQYRIRY